MTKDNNHRNGTEESERCKKKETKEETITEAETIWTKKQKNKT